jgi:hypothetical protein
MPILLIGGSLLHADSQIDPKVRLITVIEAIIGWLLLLLFGSLLVREIKK